MYWQAIKLNKIHLKKKFKHWFFYIWIKKQNSGPGKLQRVGEMCRKLWVLSPTLHVPMSTTRSNSPASWMSWWSFHHWTPLTTHCQAWALIHVDYTVGPSTAESGSLSFLWVPCPTRKDPYPPPKKQVKDLTQTKNKCLHAYQKGQEGFNSTALCWYVETRLWEGTQCCKYRY